MNKPVIFLSYDSSNEYGKFLLNTSGQLVPKLNEAKGAAHFIMRCLFVLPDYKEWSEILCTHNKCI